MVGLRELAMVAAVVLALYGRTSVLRSPRFQAIWPWIAPVRRKPGGAVAGRRRDDPSAMSSNAEPAARRRWFRLEGNRLFWFLTILAATAVATSIVTRSLILQSRPVIPHP